MAFERIKARAERREANAAALPEILGKPCKAGWTFKDPGAGFDVMAAWWVQTAQSPVIALGNLKMPTGTRTFRIVCDGATAVVHPDDAGWLVRAVEPLMTRVKPIWAHASTTRTLPGGISVQAGRFPWLPKQWTCPECWPQIDLSGACNPNCTVQARFGGPWDGLVALYGYDNRLMRPWVSNINQVPDCNKGAPGGENTLCMPVEGACGFNRASEYIQAFWQDVAQAVGAYNANPPPRETTPQTAVVEAPKAPIKQDVNWLPLLAFGLGTGLLGVFVWNTRR